MLRLARVRLTAASEEGFGLVEVVVSAVVLVIAVLGVLAALDSVSHTAGANQSKTVAATLAEKDLERLRGLRTEDLSRLAEIEDEESHVTVGNIEYTIESKAQLVADSTGEDVSCSVSSGKGNYLRITSTVSSPMTGDGHAPVVMTSIVAPQPGRGTLTGWVKNARGQNVKNLPVQAIGPSPDTKQTNDVGCAIFDDSEAGSYTLRLNQAGWVDKDGNQTVEKLGTVSAGNVTTVEFMYDLAGSFPVNVVNSANVADPYQGLMAAHTGLTTGFRSKTVSPFTGMFPFVEPYQVYAGTCTGNNPDTYIDGYFDTHPAAVAQVDPGLGGPVRTVLEPSINVTAKYTRSSGTVEYPNSSTFKANLYATPKTTGCDPNKFPFANTSQNGTGTFLQNGLPFGSYDICVQLLRSGTTYRQTFTNVQNTDPAGKTIAANFTSSSTQGSC
jgi:Tfp pilus assembly protein PilV